MTFLLQWLSGVARHIFPVLQGETAEEVAGLARAMREMGLHVHVQGSVLDIVGTGGDGIGSVNISTGAMVIAAAAGARVAKHGNRSVSSLCGSADVLEVNAICSSILYCSCQPVGVDFEIDDFLDCEVLHLADAACYTRTGGKVKCRGPLHGHQRLHARSDGATSTLSAFQAATNRCK